MARACMRLPPLQVTAPADCRPDLVLEVLRVLYTLGVNGHSAPMEDATSQIRIVLCELLQHPSADGRLYKFKLAVGLLLLDVPHKYGSYLLNNGGIEPLVEIMELQTLLVVVEGTGSSAEDAAAVMPILLVLLRLVQSSELVLKVMRDAVFPPDLEVTFEWKAAAEMGRGWSEGKVDARNMAGGTAQWSWRWSYGSG